MNNLYEVMTAAGFNLDSTIPKDDDDLVRLLHPSSNKCPDTPEAKESNIKLMKFFKAMMYLTFDPSYTYSREVLNSVIYNESHKHNLFGGSIVGMGNPPTMVRMLLMRLAHTLEKPLVEYTISLIDGLIKYYKNDFNPDMFKSYKNGYNIMFGLRNIRLMLDDTTDVELPKPLTEEEFVPAESTDQEGMPRFKFKV